MSSGEEILKYARGFMQSRVILTGAELDIFTKLHAQPLKADALAEDLKSNIRSLTRLLDCLVALGYLLKKNGQYSVTGAGALLSSKHKESVLPMVMHLAALWHSWSNFTETVKQGKNPSLNLVTESDDETFQSFINAMHVVGKHMAADIASSYDTSAFKSLLDIGGGSGTYIAAFLKQNSALKAVLFDLPRTLPMAEKRLEQEGLMDRVKITGGDYTVDELPSGCDLALLSAIIHQNSDMENISLYQKIHRALETGGTLLIRDHIMDESRTSPPSGTMFAINMLVNTSGGDTYTFLEVKKSLESAGFSDIRQIRSGANMDCLVEAKKL